MDRCTLSQPRAAKSHENGEALAIVGVRFTAQLGDSGA